MPKISPQTYARTGGLLYLFVIVAALFGEVFVRGPLVVSGDPTATALRILHSETLFRAGIAAEMLTCVCDVALAMILYALLSPVSRNLALLGAFFRLTFVAFYSVAKLFLIAAVVVLGRGEYLKMSFEPQQLHSMAYLALSIHDYGYGASLLFFGFCTLVFGYLIWKSVYLPRTLGAVLIIAGAGYILYSLAQILSPAFAGKVLFPWLLLPGFVAELGLSVWLFMKGVNVPEFRTRCAV